MLISHRQPCERRRTLIYATSPRHLVQAIKDCNGPWLWSHSSLNIIPMYVCCQRLWLAVAAGYYSFSLIAQIEVLGLIVGEESARRHFANTSGSCLRRYLAPFDPVCQTAKKRTPTFAFFEHFESRASPQWCCTHADSPTQNASNDICP